MLLNTRDSSTKTVKDFTEKHRIALAGPKVSPQAITLQLAAAHAFDTGKYAQLDHTTYNMSHPFGMQAFGLQAWLSATHEVTAHFTSPGPACSCCANAQATLRCGTPGHSRRAGTW
jgi:NitT/TauT family transport system substrate-binding protein